MSDWNTKGFKIGDKVRVETHIGFLGEQIEGGIYEIFNLERKDYTGPHNVRLANGNWANAAHMAKVAGFEEIKVGDKIRVTKDYGNGETVARIGVVEDVSTQYIETGQFSFYNNDAHQTFEVLERAKAPLPTVSGSLIVATVGDDENVALVLLGSSWHRVDKFGTASPHQITDWVSAKVVAQD